MELHRFKELKEKGGASLQKLGPKTYQIVSKRYDASTGEELEPELQAVNIEGIDNSLKALEKQINDLTKMKEGLEQLKAEVEADTGAKD